MHASRGAAVNPTLVPYSAISCYYIFNAYSAIIQQYFSIYFHSANELMLQTSEASDDTYVVLQLFNLM